MEKVKSCRDALDIVTNLCIYVNAGRVDYGLFYCEFTYFFNSFAFSVLSQHKFMEKLKSCRDALDIVTNLCIYVNAG
ncbi:hypothetical protein Tco_0049229, partial [Tanacetum coccineum]